MTHDLSLGEVQALCTKAARGAGRAVGVAEDAGRAVRWLQARGMDGAEVLVTLLRATDRRAADEMIPALPTMVPVGQAMCPLALGAYLSDIGEVPEGVVGPVWAPELLLPFVSALRSGGVTVERASDGDPCTIHLVAGTAPMRATLTRARVAATTLDALNAFAARTYVPATEESRASGAGAGLSDND